jgi:hypothetical protein
MLEFIQTFCLVVSTLALSTIALRLGTIIQAMFPKPPQPFDYTEIDRKTFGDSDLAQRNSDYPLGH